MPVLPSRPSPCRPCDRSRRRPPPSGSGSPPRDRSAAGRPQPSRPRGERLHRCRRPDDQRARAPTGDRGGRSASATRNRSTPSGLRVAAASFARAASKHADLATTLADVDGVEPKSAGQAVAEGVLLGSYRYVGRKTDASLGSKLDSLAIVAGDKRAKHVEQGVERGHIVANAGVARPRVGEHAADLSQRQGHRRAGRGHRRRVRPDGRGVQQGSARAARLRRAARRQPRVGRAAADGQADVLAAQPHRPPRARRQGDHVRLGWDLAEGRRRLPPDHEDGHVGRRGGARRRCRRSRRCAARPRSPPT